MSLKQRFVKNTAPSLFGDGIHATFITQIQGITVDNYSGQWLKISQEGLFIPPYTLGWTSNLYSSKTAVDIVSATPATTFQLTINTSRGDVVVSFYDNFISPSGGYSIAPQWFSYLSNTRYYAASFRTVGDATVKQKIMSLQNGNASTSTVLVGLRRCTVTVNHTVAALTVAPWLRLSNNGGSTGGTTLSKQAQAPVISPASNAAVLAKGATASDGGVATVLSADFGGVFNYYRQSFISREATVAGYIEGAQVIELQSLNDPPIIIGQAVAPMDVVVYANVAGDNPATNHYLAEMEWEEYSLT
jgi:hypothetical protein